jgi:hypothetical protein
MTDREWKAIDSLAEDEWEIFKQKVKAECEQMASVTSMDFRYTETSATLEVQRFENGVAMKVLRLRFDAAVPRIVWQCLNPSERKGWITFQLHGPNLFYLFGNVNTPIPEIIARLTMCLTGQL